MVGHVQALDQDERRELLALLTQQRKDELLTDEEVLAELSETLRRQLSLSAATDLAEGFRRRMIRIAEELGEPHAPGYYDFRSDREIAEYLLEQVGLQAEELSKSDLKSDFMVDFAKTFQTMSQDSRAAWLRKAAVAASTAQTGQADAQQAADAARWKSRADQTAQGIAAAMAVFYEPTRAAVAAGAKRAAPTAGFPPAALAAAAATLGLIAGGAVAHAIRKRRDPKQEAAVQVRRERQATQAVVTTCAYILATVDAPRE
jgi:hypothetical protein